MFFRGGPLLLLGHGAAALAILVLAVPSIFKTFSQKQGLSISLAIFLTYVFQAVFHFVSKSSSKEVGFINLHTKKRLFKVLETFLILISVYVGLQWMPSSLLLVYEYLIVISHPLMTLLEGFCFMIVLLSFGQCLMNILMGLDKEEKQTPLTIVKACLVCCFL